MKRNTIYRTLAALAFVILTMSPALAESNGLVIMWDGDGSADKPYLVKTAEQLAYIATCTTTGNTFSGVHFKMANDIDLSGYDNWTPIGNGSTDAKFMGVFDGGGFTIDNLTVTGESEDFRALFGGITSATIKNLTIGSSSSIVGRTRIAAVVAYAGVDCIISDVYNEAAVTGYGETIGGIVGMSGGNITLSNCTNSGTIKSLLSSESPTFVGGIAGFCNNGVISNCVNSGSVISDKGVFTGGIIGCGAGNPGAENMIIIGCTNSGTVSSASSSVGGIAGAVGQTTDAIIQIAISACTNTGKVSSSAGKFVGGIAGATNSPCVRVRDCRNNGQIVSEHTEQCVGGIIGYSNYGIISDCVNNESVTANGGTSYNCESIGGIVGMIAGMELYDSSVKNCLNNGAVSSQGSYTGGIVGLYAGSQTAERPHYIHVKLVENCTNKGNITNTESTNGSSNVGGIVGHGPAIVNKCKNEASVTGKRIHVGGIVGTCGTIINCCNTGNITCNSSGTTYDDAGGLLGFNWTEVYGQDLFIANSYSRGDIKTAGSINFVGTVAASGYTAIYNCYGSGRVQYSGGESKYVVGACYHDGEPRIFSAHTYNKYGVFGGPTEYKSQVLLNENANAHEIENYIIKDGEPYSNYHNQTVLSFLQGRQGSLYKQFSVGDPLSPVITIEALAWKKGDDGYPVFVTDPGYVEPVVPTYTVSYNLNATGSASGISAPSQQSGSQSYTVSDIVSEGIYSYVSGNVKYSFIGWNTKADGTGDSYVAGSNIAPLENTTLYAQWEVGYQLRYSTSETLSRDKFISLTLPFDDGLYAYAAEVEVKNPGTFEYDGETAAFLFWSENPDGSGKRYNNLTEAEIAAGLIQYNKTVILDGDKMLYANIKLPSVQTLTIGRSGLKPGQTAIYTVSGPEGVNYTVALTGVEGEGPAEVSRTITGITKMGEYIVRETGWEWTSTKGEPAVAPESQKKDGTGEGVAVINIDDNRPITVTFSATGKEELPDHSEDSKGVIMK